MRVFSAFAVIVIHVCAETAWCEADVHSLDWQAANFWDSLVRWAVPVFVMISGALFLNPDKAIPTKKLYTKYIFRISTAFLFWSSLYACSYYALNRDIAESVSMFMNGFAHMWFLFMIVGLYMSVPILRKIAQSRAVTWYFLLLSLIFVVVRAQAIYVMSLFLGDFGTLADKYVSKFQPFVVMGYSGYFLLGYALDRAVITGRLKRVIYIAGAVGVISSVVLTSLLSLMQGKVVGIFFDCFTVNVLCESAAVFMFFREKLNFAVRFVRVLSQYSFGAYLVHFAVILALKKLGLNSMTFSPVISIPVISLMVFILSFTISAILNHIPVLKKYIV